MHKSMCRHSLRYFAFFSVFFLWPPQPSHLAGTLTHALTAENPGHTDTSQAEMPIEIGTLPNGMQIVFVPYHRVPVVTVQIWYHVGSKDEKPGYRGVAHMFEHMMFKGSKRVRPEEHARMLSALGGNVNAFTAHDLTAYHNTLPKQYLSFAMALEAERLKNLQLTQATIDSEREVVKEEKRLRMENSPIGRAIEKINALTFTKHPYAWTPAGDIPDLNRVTPEFCRQFYKKYYIPNNATLVVVGDVTKEEVWKQAKSHFGGLERQPDPPRVTITEPPQTSPRTFKASWPSQLNVVLGAYHVPQATHPDLAALTVLSTILSSGRSSRLYKQLVRRKKAALEAGGFVRELEHPGIFLVYAVGLPKQNIQTMQTLLLKEVYKIAKRGVKRAELNKAKNQLATAHLRSLETAYGIAQQIGMSTYVYGDPRAFLEDVKKIDLVTVADVKRVAATYLKPSGLNLVLVAAGQKKRGDS